MLKYPVIIFRYTNVISKIYIEITRMIHLLYNPRRAIKGTAWAFARATLLVERTIIEQTILDQPKIAM
jgi:hypothetical protein